MKILDFYYMIQNHWNVIQKKKVYLLFHYIALLVSFKTYFEFLNIKA